MSAKYNFWYDQRHRVSFGLAQEPLQEALEAEAIALQDDLDEGFAQDVENRLARDAHYRERVQNENNYPRQENTSNNAMRYNAEARNQVEPKTMTEFRPAFAVLRKFGLATVTARRVPGGNGYLGDTSISGNKSANIPDTKNCALWITGLPADITFEQLLGSIRNVGKVYTTFINPPTSNHVASAAKIVFFNHRAAENLFQAIQGGTFSVMNQAVLDVRWSRIKSAPYQATDHSRAIKITGTSDLMDIMWFKSFFDRRFLYQLECVIQEPSTRPGKDTQIWRFASVRCQAAWAKLAIERELRGIFTADWAEDPCDLP